MVAGDVYARRLPAPRDAVVAKLALAGNAGQLAVVAAILSGALALQLALGELPCPLCLLQRVGFFAVAVGLMLNVRFGPRPAHYALTLLAALFTAFVALRQVALHVVPGTGAYGAAVWGLHLYTWSFVAAMTVVVVTAALLGFGGQYRAGRQPLPGLRGLSRLLFALIAALLVANLVSVTLECGTSQCPDNPVRYELLS